jgi:hypothetical protein
MRGIIALRSHRDLVLENLAAACSDFSDHFAPLGSMKGVLHGTGKRCATTTTASSGRLCSGASASRGSDSSSRRGVLRCASQRLRCTVIATGRKTSRSDALRAFLDDLRAARLEDRVAVVTFSEFGRRVEENASQGTDHGTAGPVLVAGGRVRAGLIGTTPSLADLQDGDLQMSVDFRSVYATLLEEWLELSSRDVLAGQFAHLPLLRA